MQKYVVNGFNNVNEKEIVIKDFGFKKKNRQEVKLRLRRDKWGDNYEFYLPIADEKIKKEFRELKKKILFAIDKATASGNDQLVNYGTTAFNIHPKSDKSILKKFKPYEW